MVGFSMMMMSIPLFLETHPDGTIWIVLALVSCAAMCVPAIWVGYAAACAHARGEQVEADITGITELPSHSDKHRRWVW